MSPLDCAIFITFLRHHYEPDIQLE